MEALINEWAAKGCSFHQAVREAIGWCCSFPRASSRLVPSYLGNPYVNDDRLVQCQHCKEDDGGKDGEESTFFHGIVTPAPIQKIWGIGRLFPHPAGKRKSSP
ncbi:hypothetical protein U8C40_38300 (plasmid) [Sinorhizobium medicae]|uniref:hypothetical protein n=1 Tax=Sinorhizobium medicae TaxID=110321 RepID=UPI002B1BE138|nr:hypothetical protein [Sinorhizobium medicae]WQO49011.1 hypothetical protein U8C42_30465 [Sinorhizobium medicae]WQO70604.1 hypothetical protein U8C40_38300 [Sinorhizobium medicae]